MKKIKFVKFNAQVLRKEIINKKNKHCYIWVNLVNNKIYFGSSVNLGRRISEYFSPNLLKDINLQSFT